jgi:hypothetical protein
MRILHYIVIMLGVSIAVLVFLLSTPALGVELKSSDPVGYIYLPRERPNVSLEVLVAGRPVPTIAHAGKTYLPVPRLGSEYQIRVHNFGSRRIVAIVSVDGLSVLNGKPASSAHPGYIVDAGNHIVIKGWRRDLDTVAAFSFEEREKSYAALVGRSENIGVIGLIAIEEQAHRPWPIEGLKRSTAPALPLKEYSDVGGTGTGYGRELDSHIYYVPFARSNNIRTLSIYYDTVEVLRRIGVPVDGPTTPIPFPGDTEFVPPPPTYRFR